MTPLDFITGQPWAILPAALEGLIALAGRDADGVREAFARLPGEPWAVAAKAGRPMDNARTVEVRDGVAVVPVRGVMSRYSTVFHEVCGGTSYQVLAKDVRAAADNPHVRAILLDIDSPGGQAVGCGELAAQVREASRSKPVCAYVGGLGCSAAYWLASAASEVIAHPTATLGSIGAVMSVDTSAPKGQVKFRSSQSPLKQADPTTEEGRTEIQAWVDALAAEFVDTVAEYRGTTPDAVLSGFGRGGIKVGRAAVDAGMADAVGDFESCLSRLSRGEKAAPPQPKPEPKPAGTPGAKPKGASASMDFRKLFASYIKANPEAAAAAVESGDGADDLTAVLSAAALKPAPAADADAIRRQVEAELTAKVKAESDAGFKAFFDAQAGAWFDSLVAGGKAVPADKAKAVALYVDAAMADRSGLLSLGDGATLSRLSALTERYEAAPDNGLQTTAVRPGVKPAEVRDRMKMAVLPAGDDDADADAKAKADARVNRMLAVTGNAPAE